MLPSVVLSQLFLLLLLLLLLWLMVAGKSRRPVAGAVVVHLGEIQTTRPNPWSPWYTARRSPRARYHSPLVHSPSSRGSRLRG